MLWRLWPLSYSSNFVLKQIHQILLLLPSLHKPIYCIFLYKINSDLFVLNQQYYIKKVKLKYIKNFDIIRQRLFCLKLINRITDVCTQLTNSNYLFHTIILSFTYPVLHAINFDSRYIHWTRERRWGNNVSNRQTLRLSDEWPAVAIRLDEPTNTKSLVTFEWHLKLWKWQSSGNVWVQQLTSRTWWTNCPRSMHASDNSFYSMLTWTWW